ncbi:MAG: hypothetical protein R2794_09470 [Chitinophagales bacterium]
MEPSFNQVYDAHMVHDLREADRIRRKILLNYCIIGFVLFVGFVAETVTWMSIAILFIIVFVFLYTHWYGIPYNRYEKAYIQAITQNTIHALAPGMQIDVNSYIRHSRLAASGLLDPVPDMYSGRSLLFNTENTALDISEIFAKETTQGKEHILNALVGIRQHALPEAELWCITHDEQHARLFAASKHTDLKHQNGMYICAKGDGMQAMDNAWIEIAEKTSHTLHLPVFISAVQGNVCAAILLEPKFVYFSTSVMRSAMHKAPAEIYYLHMQELLHILQKK